MVIFKNEKDIAQYLTEKKQEECRLGFVPTMGALHHGHRSLVERAKADGLFVIASIFVNPTQFNNAGDLEHYPVSTEADIEMLLTAGCDVLFLPTVAEIYPAGPERTPTFDFGYLDTILEGASRPGHFKGVGQVVARLLQIVQPSVLFLGQKDYQQCMVIRKLSELMGLDLEIVICPTAREADGLAMSSRNRRLTETQRAVAGTIYQCLVSIESKQLSAPFEVVKKECEDILASRGFRTEYVALADAANLELLSGYQPLRPMVALIAASIGDIRLIDNIVLRKV